MGRWGHRMFEGDVDLDLAIEVDQSTVGEGTEAHLFRLIYQADMYASQESRDYYKTEEYRLRPEGFVEEERELLDSGLCDVLFQKLCAGRYPQYQLILTALMMRTVTGATIRADDLDYVRSMLPSVPSRNGFQYPVCDDGFRDPGKVQFEVALTYYRNGVPRDFGVYGVWIVRIIVSCVVSVVVRPSREE
ncbi:hypothetical protein FB451DRAFT_1032273 [Mycena latifolia]|nr:hypothetical protein FB451DRAFT_1032273 [Mycena latifolia]